MHAHSGHSEFSNLKGHIHYRPSWLFAAWRLEQAGTVLNTSPKLPLRPCHVPIHMKVEVPPASSPSCIRRRRQQARQRASSDSFFALLQRRMWSANQLHDAFTRVAFKRPLDRRDRPASTCSEHAQLCVTQQNCACIGSCVLRQRNVLSDHGKQRAKLGTCDDDQ